MTDPWASTIGAEAIYPLWYPSAGRIRRYYKKVLHVERASLISYLPLWEASGAVAYDLSGNGRNGASVGVTLGEPGMGDGRTSYGFDGALDYVNWYSAGLAAAFNGAEYTALMYLRVPSVAVWQDATFRRALRVMVDANNYFEFYKESGAGSRLLIQAKAGGGAVKGAAVYTAQGTSFLCAAIVRSEAGQYIRGYVDGVQQFSQADTDTWAGPPAATTTVIGASNTGPVNPWLGNVAHVQLRNKALTAAQIAYLSKR